MPEAEGPAAPPAAEPSHHVAAGATPPDVAVPSDLALRRLHLPDAVAERGAPGIGFGE